MSGGPFRSARPTTRGSVQSERSDSAPAPQPVEKPETPTHKEVHVSESHTPAQPAKRLSTKKQARFSRRSIVLATAGLVVVVALVAGLSLNRGGDAPGIDANKYQAVFLVNGDIYFGKLESAGEKHMKLSNIYYIQSEEKTTTEDAEATDQGNVKLIKLGEEIYGPEDTMIISRDQIMLYENLKSDGKVAQAIDQYKSSGQ